MARSAVTEDVLLWYALPTVAKGQEREGEQPHDAISSLFDRLRPDLEERRTQYELYRAVFSEAERELFGYTTDTIDAGDDSFSYEGEITTNVARAIVKGLLSKTVKNRPLPSALVKRGDWHQHLQGRQLNQYIDGDFAHGRIFQTTKVCALHALIYGTGFAYTFEQNGETKTEHVPPDELVVDTVDGAELEPLTIGRIKLVDRHVLAARFPKHKEAIMSAGSVDPNIDGRDTETLDLIELREAWHLPVGEEKGRHFLGIDGATFDFSAYEPDHFRFGVLRWAIDPKSFFGRGCIADLMPIQAELNRLAQHIQESHYVGANFLWWIDTASEVETEKIGNLPGLFIRGTGQPPVKLVGATVDPEIYAHYERLFSKAFQLVGFNELQATGMKPAGLSSGKALRVYADLGSEVFANWAQDWERFHLDIAEHRLEVAREIRKETGKAPRREFTFQRRWVDEVELPDLKHDGYRLRVTPVSALSEDIAGKLSEVSELISLGVITDPVEVRRLLSLSDLEADNDLATASRELAEWAFDEIMYGGNAMTCEPEWDANLCKTIALAKYRECVPHRPPPDRAEMVREYIRSCQRRLDALAAETAPPPAAMPPGAMPPGMPPTGPGPMPPINVPSAPPMAARQAWAPQMTARRPVQRQYYGVYEDVNPRPWLDSVVVASDVGWFCQGCQTWVDEDAHCECGPTPMPNAPGPMGVM